jgi:hypothetical protein
MQPLVDVTEQKRLTEGREAQVAWKKWGPYLSERQWGTVREDCSSDGNAWDLYKYPQREYPYADLIETNRKRPRKEFEYELLDTGVFNDDRYYDVFVEYAKEGPEDIRIRITVQ